MLLSLKFLLPRDDFYVPTWLLSVALGRFNESPFLPFLPEQNFSLYLRTKLITVIDKLLQNVKQMLRLFVN
jgi:hypothetical protein